MSREILFRGKQKHNGEWIEGQYVSVLPVDMPKRYRKLKAVIFPTNAECNWFNKYFYKSMEVIPETVGQYTGLKDKNDKRIFEGDIVRYGDTVHEVVFEQRNGTAYFGLVYSEIETLPFGHYQDLKQIEIIGNIHDNPELLEANNE